MIIPNLWKHKNVPNHQPVMFNLEWKIQVYSVHFVRRRKKHMFKLLVLERLFTEYPQLSDSTGLHPHSLMVS